MQNTHTSTLTPGSTAEVLLDNRTQHDNHRNWNISTNNSSSNIKSNDDDKTSWTGGSLSQEDASYCIAREAGKFLPHRTRNKSSSDDKIVLRPFCTTSTAAGVYCSLHRYYANLCNAETPRIGIFDRHFNVRCDVDDVFCDWVRPYCWQFQSCHYSIASQSLHTHCAILTAFTGWQHGIQTTGTSRDNIASSFISNSNELSSWWRSRMLPISSRSRRWRMSFALGLYLSRWIR